MAKSNKTHYAILGMLAIEPMSGYEIRQTMRQSTENFWSESDGQLYPALAALNKRGLVCCKTVESAGNREKKVYRITAKGSTELRKWLFEQAEKQSIRSEFMLKLFFGANVSAEINLDHVQAHRYQVKSGVARLNDTKKSVTEEEKDSQHLPYWLMCIDYGIKIAQAKLAWCDNTISILEKMKAKEK